MPNGTRRANGSRKAAKQSAGTAKQNQQNGGAMIKKIDQLLSRIPRGTFATVGGVLGGPKGAMIGKGISTLTGYGDYNVRTNSLMNHTVIGEMADQVPMFKQQGADTRLKHCEYVCDVVVPDNQYDYNVQTFDIDPTNAGTFPWLASVAQKYQRYKVKGMVIGFRSTSTDYQNSGVVAIAVNYDSAEQSYESMEGLLNTKFAVSTKPSTSMLAPVECDPSRSPLDGYYVKHVTSLDDNDATRRQTIMGTINVATSGLTLTPGTSLGQLYISYDIEFLYPYLHRKQLGELVTGGGALGIVNYGSAATFNSDFNNKAYGVVKAYGTGADPTRVLAVYKASPTATVLPSNAPFWLGFVMPVGKWVLQYSEGPWLGPGGSGNLSAGTLPVHNGSYGSAITLSEPAIEHHAAACSSSQYTIVVVPGTEESRTIFPAGQVGRVLTATNGYINIGCWALKIDN